jgi:peptide/nickel transport system substrate-binding protein
MQEILYRDSPYLVTAYSAIGEAVRSDRFACFVPQPNPGGVWLEQYGVYNYLHMKPVASSGQTSCDEATAGGLTGAVQSTSAGDESSSSGPFLIVVGALVVVVLIGGGVLLMRRRQTVADRE